MSSIHKKYPYILVKDDFKLHLFKHNF